MEKTVDSLEGMFRKTEKDLDFLSRKLDCQLENMQEVDQRVNPVKMMKKMENIKAEYANIVQDVLAVQEAQKEMSDYFRSQLLTLTGLLGKLETATGVQSSLENESTQEVFGQLSCLLGIPRGELESQAGCSASASTSDGSLGSQAGQTTGTVEQASEIAHRNSESSNQQGSTDNTDKKKLESSSVERRRRDKDKFCEVSEDEFKSVSRLITQRLKLEEVNKVYRCLWQHFKEEKNIGKLTPKEMNALGLRVTGASGEAKLKVLRALKLCQITRNGEVTLV